MPGTTEAARVAGLSALILAGCGATDAELYLRALSEAADWDGARRACQGIDDANTREDCLLAAIEKHQRLNEADCALLELPVWHEECLFQLAERQRAAGDLDLAIRTCDRTRYARPCAWHLLQDEVQLTLDEPASEAEIRAEPFERSRALPDALDQLWAIRFREAAGRGRVLDEADCEGLRDPEICRQALRNHVRRVLDAIARKGAATACAAEPGRRAMNQGAPAWKLGPVTAASEAAWAADRCR